MDLRRLIALDVAKYYNTETYEFRVLKQSDINHAANVEPIAIDSSNWRDEAACIGMSRYFFAPRGERQDARSEREVVAAKFCGSCSVRDQCLSEAVSNGEYHYWAGTEELERDAMGATLPYKKSHTQKIKKGERSSRNAKAISVRVTK